MAYVRGNNLANSLTGTDGDDRIVGAGGDDGLFGLDGADKIFGGSGNDAMPYFHYSSLDIDRFYGGDGNDLVTLEFQSETQNIMAKVDAPVVTIGHEHVLYLSSVERLNAEFGSGDDYFVGGRYGCNAYGGDGNDRLFGNNGAENLYGQSGDTLRGDGGDDLLVGGNGRDSLIGGDDQDTLLGGESGDFIDGGAGVDRITGGEGADRLTGGAGHDRFVFGSLTDAGDTITDFTPGQDRLLFLRDGFGQLQQVDATNFVANKSGVAITADDRFLYSTKSNSLFYDADGTGSGAAVLVAHVNYLAPTATLTYHDLVMTGR